MKPAIKKIDGVPLRAYVPEFEPLGHRYTTPDTGLPLDSVTTCLTKGELGLYQYGNMSYAERGTNVHLACQYFCEGTLKMDTLCAEYIPYLEKFKRLVKLFDISIDRQVCQNEVKVYHPSFYIAGTIDLVTTVKGIPAILDIKTGHAEVWHKWQTAAYEKMRKLWDGIDRKRYCLLLKPEIPDNDSLIEHTESNDWPEFYTLAMAWKIKVKNGYGKIKKEKYDNGNIE
jgi:hypothetical protein